MVDFLGNFILFTEDKFSLSFYPMAQPYLSGDPPLSEYNCSPLLGSFSTSPFYKGILTLTSEVDKTQFCLSSYQNKNTQTRSFTSAYYVEHSREYASMLTRKTIYNNSPLLEPRQPM